MSITHATAKIVTVPATISTPTVATMVVDVATASASIKQSFQYPSKFSASVESTYNKEAMHLLDEI